MSRNVVASNSVTVRSAAEFKHDLLAAFESSGDVMLDLDALSEVDLSFVQMVCAAREQCARDGRTLALLAPAPAPVTALLDRAGFLTELTQQDIQFWFHGELPQ